MTGGSLYLERRGPMPLPLCSCREVQVVKACGPPEAGHKRSRGPAKLAGYFDASVVGLRNGFGRFANPSQRFLYAEAFALGARETWQKIMPRFRSPDAGAAAKPGWAMRRSSPSVVLVERLFWEEVGYARTRWAHATKKIASANGRQARPQIKEGATDISGTELVTGDWG